MKTTSVTPADLIASIIALPPIARTADGRINADQSRKIVDWLSTAGVTSFMYGGIANFFNMALSEYAAVLDLIEAITPPGALVVPSIGPDYGKAIDQVAVLRGRGFPSAILLPFTPASAAGVATGLRRLADAYGKPLMVFFKSEDYLTPADAAALLADGVLCAVEYGLPRDPTGKAPYLTALLDKTGSAARIIDGAGERSIVGHAEYGLKGYTSGSGIIAPHLSMALLAAVKAGDLKRAAQLREHFLPLEALRAANGPVPVLHEAIALAGIADTGPLGPFFANVTDPTVLRAITKAATALKAASVSHSS